MALVVGPGLQPRAWEIPASASRGRHCCPSLLALAPAVPRHRPRPVSPPQVVCARCSDYRAELQYDQGHPHRVCAACYTFLTGRVLPEDRKRGILQVRPTQATAPPPLPHSLCPQTLVLTGLRPQTAPVPRWFCALEQPGQRTPPSLPWVTDATDSFGGTISPRPASCP